jgi:hypothetical protein
MWSGGSNGFRVVMGGHWLIIGKIGESMILEDMGAGMGGEIVYVLGVDVVCGLGVVGVRIDACVLYVIEFIVV